MIRMLERREINMKKFVCDECGENEGTFHCGLCDKDFCEDCIGDHIWSEHKDKLDFVIQNSLKEDIKK
jgi:hypothetical protein